MSYSEVYGLKFSYKKLREILREKYEGRASEKWEKYILFYMVDELSADVLKNCPDHKIQAVATGCGDEAGDDCVLGIEICRYYLKELDDDPDVNDGDSDFDHFDDFDRYNDHGYGWEIHQLKHLKLPPLTKKAYDLVIDGMKKLIDDPKVQKMTPSVYRVEDAN